MTGSENVIWEDVLGAPFPLREVPKPTDLPDLSKPGVPLVSEATLRNAAATADHLDYLTGVIHSEDIRAWLNDGSIYLREIVAAIREMQRPLQ